MSAIARICPACHGVRGLRGMEKRGEHLCVSSDDCMRRLFEETKEEMKGRAAKHAPKGEAP